MNEMRHDPPPFNGLIQTKLQDKFSKNSIANQPVVDLPLY
jgi:hypothetical protein